MTEPESPVAPYFRALARAMIRGRFVVIALCLGLAAAMGFVAATRLRVDNSTSGLLGHDAPAMRVLARLEDAFGEDSRFAIIVEGDVGTKRYIERLAALRDALLALEVPLLEGLLPSPEPRATTSDDAFADAAFEDFGAASQGASTDDGRSIVEDVSTLLDAPVVRAEADGVHVGPLFSTSLDDASARSTLALALREADLVPTVLARDGRSSLVTFRTVSMREQDQALVHDAVVALLARHESPGFHLELSGLPSLLVTLNRTMERDIGFVFGLSIVAMIGLLVFMFRSVLGVLGPLAIVLVSVAFTLGTMALTGAPMTGVTSVLGTFLLVVGMADAIHVQASYRDARFSGRTREDAIIDALAHTGVPVIVTTVTTALGLLSFHVSDLASVVDLGTYAAIGVLYALVLTLVLQPAMLTFDGARYEVEAEVTERREDWLDRMLSWCERLSRPEGASVRRPVRVVLVALVVTAIASVGGAFIEPYHDPLSWLATDDPVRVAIERVDRDFGGGGDVTLLVTTGPSRDAFSLDVLRRIERIERSALAYRDHGRVVVTSVVSVLDPIRRANQAVHGGDRRYRRLPDDARGLTDLRILVESGDREGISRFVSSDARMTRVMMRVRWLPAHAYVPLVEHVTRRGEEALGSLAQLEITGSVRASFDVVSALIDDLIATFGSAFLTIAIVMMLLARDVKLGLVSMVPNVLPILVVMGGLGLFGVPLDLNTVMVASIAEGLAVDDTIHFLYHYQLGKRTLGSEGAVRATFEGSGRAMTFTSITLAVGFLLFGFASMSNVQRFGIVIAVTVVLALLTELVLTPALLRLVYRDREGDARST